MPRLLRKGKLREISYPLRRLKTMTTVKLNKAGVAKVVKATAVIVKVSKTCETHRLINSRSSAQSWVKLITKNPKNRNKEAPIWMTLWLKFHRMTPKLTKRVMPKRLIYTGSTSITRLRPFISSKITSQLFLSRPSKTKLSTFRSLCKEIIESAWSLTWMRLWFIVSMTLKLRIQMSSSRSISQVKKQSVLVSICAHT